MNFKPIQNGLMICWNELFKTFGSFTTKEVSKYSIQCITIAFVIKNQLFLCIELL